MEPDSNECSIFALDDHVYRIPALVRCRGRLLAFCERRADDSDSAEAQLVMKRVDRADDDPVVVWALPNMTCGNPCPVVDGHDRIHLLMTCNAAGCDESVIRRAECNRLRRVFYTRSDDCGETWAEAEEITDRVSRLYWRWYATGPGCGIVTRAGLLVFPCNHSEAVDRHLPDADYRAHLVLFDGVNWRIGAEGPPRTNESAIVERTNGRLYWSMRAQGLHHRIVGIVRPLGDRCTKTYDLYRPAVVPCQGSLVRVSDTCLVFATVAQENKQGRNHRNNLTIWMSDDDGRTWPRSHVVHDGSAAYSSMVRLDDNRVGLLYERDNYTNICYRTLRLDRIPWFDIND